MSDAPAAVPHATPASRLLPLVLPAIMVGEAQVLAVLCIAILPAWLLVTGRPEMVIQPEPAAAEPAPNAPAAS